MQENAPGQRGELGGGGLDPGTSNPEVLKRVGLWLNLQRRLFLQPARANRWLLKAAGDPSAVLARLEGSASPLGSPDGRTACRRLFEMGAWVLPQNASGYPAALRTIPDPPPVLLGRGRVELLNRPAVAIVGARAATQYGLNVAFELGEGLARAGLVVVSGLARGIDAAAHRGALKAGGSTLAVMACGPDRVYPPEHADLLAEILEKGTSITEFPLGEKPLPFHFPLRNRIISGLARAVIVVEARPRSGSLITARHALDQGREVLAVPGPITTPLSQGPNTLIRDGAHPLLEIRDALEVLGHGATQLDFSPEKSEGPDRSLDPQAERLLELILEVSGTPEELAERMACTTREVAMLLLSLEIDRRVVVDRDGRARAVLGSSR
ncbi:DNA-processing protein DprA [Myxococcota bacterium]|nr:DNA-processing protein DprA [Myxococcota bacterium]